MVIALYSVAFAHIALEEPAPRYPSTGSNDNKACPCGVGDSNRTCDNPNDRSDPDRSTDIATYAPGQVVTFRWREVVGHTGRYRIAFDPEGADMADFNSNILVDVEDPSGSTGNVGAGNLWELDVTIPNVPCDNCTLQLIQVMNGNTNDPVPDPIGISTYYQCADIVISDQADTDTDTDTDLPPVDNLDDGCGCSSATALTGSWILGLGLIAAGRRRSGR